MYIILTVNVIACCIRSTNNKINLALFLPKKIKELYVVFQIKIIQQLRIKVRHIRPNGEGSWLCSTPSEAVGIIPQAPCRRDVVQTSPSSRDLRAATCDRPEECKLLPVKTLIIRPPSTITPPLGPLISSYLKINDMVLV